MLWTDAPPPAEFIPTRTITTSWLLLVERLTDNALARLMLLWAVPSSATTLDWGVVLVVVGVVVVVVVVVVELEDELDVADEDEDDEVVLLLADDDCIIASTRVTPLSPGLTENE